MRTSKWISLAAAMLCVAMIGTSAFGQDKPYPTKSVTYLVTFDPGGQSDREARRQQPLLEKILGQKVIVDYKVGGGGALGWSELVRSQPDGYLMAGINIPHIILQPMQQATGYKTEQIVPVAIFQRTPLALAVLKTSPYKTLKDFMDAAKAKSGDISIGGSGTFSGHHVATLRLQKMAGTKFNYVPFTGAAPQITAFLGGHVNAIFGNSDDLVKHADSIRVLAVAADNRFFGFPETPTFKETGGRPGRVDRPRHRPAAQDPGRRRQEARGGLHADRQGPGHPGADEKRRLRTARHRHAESKAYIEKMTAIYKEIVQDIKK